MKRGAESQLTKEETEEGYVEPQQTPDTGFKKAPDEVLKTRVIRGLPSRTKLSNSTNGTTASPLFPPSVASPGSTSTFTSSTNSVTSPATQSSDSINTSSSSPFAKFNPFGVSSQTSSPFSSTSQTTTPTTNFAFLSSNDASTSSAPSSTSKAFASVLNNSNSNIFGSPASGNLTSSSNQPAVAHEDDSVLSKYYINLRGLNHSFLNIVSKSIEDDPFADISGFLESYKSTRLGIQKEKDGAAVSSKPESSSDPSSSNLSSSSNFFPTAVATSLFGNLPAQGASFTTAGALSTPSPTSSSLFPPAQPVSFGFSLPTASKTFSSNETPKLSLFGVSSQQPSFFKPPEHTSSITTTSAIDSTSSPAKFGSIINQSSPSIFGSNKPEAFKWSTTVEQVATGNIIGASDNSSRTPTPVANNAVHFQFGSESNQITQSQPKTAISADEKTSDDTADGGGSEQATPTTEGAGESSGNVSNLISAHNPHDDEGEGEENEITVHAIKVKAYRMRKADAKGGPGWADLGFGFLRLKRDKDTSARRMLLRNSTNGKILINFKIYSGLKPSLVKKALTFVGHDNGVSQTYCVRLPGEEQAQQLKEALDQEIESVTVKDEV